MAHFIVNSPCTAMARNYLHVNFTVNIFSDLLIRCWPRHAVRPHEVGGSSEYGHSCYQLLQSTWHCVDV